MKGVGDLERYKEVSNKITVGLIAKMGHFGKVTVEAALPTLDDIRNSVLLEDGKGRFVETIEKLTGCRDHP